MRWLLFALSCVVVAAYGADSEVLGTGLCWPPCVPTPGALPNGSCGLQVESLAKSCMPIDAKPMPAAPRVPKDEKKASAGKGAQKDGAVGK